MVLQVEGVQTVGIPVKLSRTPGRVHIAPPRFGQHTRELLIEHGYDSATVDAKSRKVQLFSTFKNNPTEAALALNKLFLYRMALRTRLNSTK
ncbi:hypothetical protein SAMN06295970_12473 [Noviherbaspirillum suwonense]|uniref:Uncharacterized protein n=1 Tax=Noviherbaspirillum suwonense TaxID=1224511 RepID=A0ABY1QRG7_9BURK|nr:hypothetical protein SAMN06295970_12473 [Noviherbaspirillum suwonense]